MPLTVVVLLSGAVPLADGRTDRHTHTQIDIGLTDRYNIQTDRDTEREGGGVNNLTESRRAKNV